MEQQDSKIHFRLPYHLPNSKEVSVPMEWMLLLGFLMGWVVGLIQGSAKEKQLARDLVWAKAKVHSLELDLARWSEKNSEWAKGMVEQLKSRTETEKVQESMSETAKAQALSKGWAWVLGQENLPKQ